MFGWSGFVVGVGVWGLIGVSRVSVGPTRWKITFDQEPFSSPRGPT
jgi:hypothetical protein